MVLILFGLVAVFLPSISCYTCLTGNFTRSIIVDEGQSVVLECYAGVDTVATIFWNREPFPNKTYENKSLPIAIAYNRVNWLVLPSITRRQNGIYSCSGDDQCGRYSGYISVIVNFKPTILEIYRIHRFASNELELRCNAESEPPAEVTWVRHNDNVRISMDSQALTYREFDDTLNSTLIMSDYDFFNDNFTYKCEFKNLFGTAEAIFKPTKMRSTPKKNRTLNSLFYNDEFYGLYL